MKPAAFAYVAPQTLDEVLAQLAEHQPGARVLAGGQSLVPLMNQRAITPAVLVDINGVAELGALHAEDGHLVLGALTRQQLLATSETIEERCPLLAEAARRVAFPAIRSRGTLGGSLAHAEPGAQLPLALLTLDAAVIIAGQGRMPRTVPVAALYRGPFATVLAADELLVEAHIPTLSPTAGYAVHEYRRGHTGPPVVAVATVLELTDEGTIGLARLSVTGVADVPLRLRAEEADLVGNTPTAALFAAVAQCAAAQVRRGDAVLADVPLRQQITRTLVARALTESHHQALQRRRNE